MDHIDELIKEKADRIRAEIKGGYLYGKPIDLDNEDMVIVGAFTLGQHLAADAAQIEQRYSRLEQILR